MGLFIYFANHIVKYIVFKKIYHSMKQVFTVILTFFLMLGGVFGQKVYKDYQDGRIYVKLKSWFNPKTGERILPAHKWDLKNLPFYNQPGAQFQITKLKRAFEVDANEKLNSTLVLEFKSISMVDQLIATLEKDPLVDYAEKIPLDKLHLTPNDPQLPNQWHLAKIGAVSAWNYASSGSNIVIAVVDDAIERNHPDLAPNIWVNPGEIAANGIDDDNNGFIDDINGWDVANNSPNVNPPDENYNHGTHVAGIASAGTNNGIGVSSIGFSCKIMCIKATNNANSITNGYNGILYAANNGAHIISMSWGGSGGSQTAENVVDYALGKGCILVASAGNDNTFAKRYPAAFDGVISVASTASDDTKSDFSNYGDWIKISAPGSNIRSTTINGTYGNLSGTSMSTPLVSGLLGLMKFLNPGMPNADLVQCLYSSADDISTQNGGFPGQLGAGRINAAKAMECVSGSLSKPPVADFSVNTQTVSAGGQLVFTDQSSYNPTGWQWTFEGGSPATFNGKNPPSIIYNTPGQYDVILTVTNTFGNNTATKLNHITVTEAPSCLTVNFPIPNNWSPSVFSAGTNNGYVNGTNGYLDKQKAMFFNLSATNHTTLTSVAIRFSNASSDFPARIVPIRVYNSNGSSGSPGTLLGTYNLTMGEIIADVSNNVYTLIDFPQSITLPASKAFFVSVDLSNLVWTDDYKDFLNVVSNDQGESNASFIWDRGEDLIWRRYGSPGTWNLTSASLFIHPFVTPNPAKSVLNPKNPVICAGNTVNFSGIGSTYTDILQWQLPGAALPQVINNQLQISKLYPNAGSFKAYLLTVGGCDELRVDSTVVTVTANPAVSANALKNPICAGESTTLSATGATSYTWSPTTGLSAATGASVTANPAQTTTYTITGTQGSCSSNVTLELEVRAKTTSVALTASQTSVTGPTPVTFTADPSNAGGNPVFNFFLNDVSKQSGNNSVYTVTVSSGDRVKCVLTSSEPCVDVKTVVSNVITMENPLPVNLISFAGRRNANGHALSWITSSEQNSAHFTLERGFNDQSFTAITQVQAAGNSNTNRFYSYLDAKPIPGKNFYRLKMTDRDGSARYSNIVLLENDDKGAIITLQPNPTQPGRDALLQINGGQTGDAFVSISNVMGQVVKSFKLTNPTGNVQVPIAASGLAQGNYIITIRNVKGEITETIKWIIIR
jgi:PKD repeat protein